ncbi:MAG TPA: phosphoenolpyruvate-utilizing N-terminal domain-containing protein, partial [Arenibaculum sp.]|nr:phosphoenolpyruvate-utilizing N-terminal domain-containing protein [Arenibaculum sp.]
MKTDADGSSTGIYQGHGPDHGGTGAAERILRGLGVSAGIAVGPAFVIESRNFQVPEFRIPPDQVADERARFHEAAAKARRQILKLKGKATVLPETAAQDIGFLLDAHLAMLG